MAELAPKDRLQPSLLDRLTDESPGEGMESREERILSLRQLRKSVIRDLEWLLNTGCFETSAQELLRFPQVRRSVLNYGIPDITGVMASNTDSKILERSLRQAIIDFEPRILPKTLKIEVIIGNEKMNANAIIFEIEGEIWAQPLPERLYLKTILDLELGSFQFPHTT